MPYAGIPIAQKGAPGGVASLGSNGQVPLAQMPELGGAVEVKDSWADDDFGGGESFTRSRAVSFASGELGPQDLVLVVGRAYFEGYMDAFTVHVTGRRNSDVAVHVLRAEATGGAGGGLQGEMSFESLWPSTMQWQGRWFDHEAETDSASVTNWTGPAVNQAWTLNLEAGLQVTGGGDYHEFAWLVNTYILRGE